MKRPLQRHSLPALVVVLLLLAWQGYTSRQPVPGGHADAGAVQAAYEARRSGLWLETDGRVTRLLDDDNDGSSHQRFILDTGNGHTVLVSHNIDLARRVPLAGGDTVRLRGRYEWNERGGVMHWTHRDPAGREDGGWIEHEGVHYR